MRKLIYFVACSVDGWIASSDGGLDGFLMGPEYLQQLAQDYPETFPGPLRDHLQITQPGLHFDTVLMGRHTWQTGADQGVLSPYPHLRQILVSQSLKCSPDPSVELVGTDPGALVRELKQLPGKDLWLCGGGTLAHSLIREIDEVILKVNPFLLGQGIPLFAGSTAVSLQPTMEVTYNNGVVRRHYQVDSRNADRKIS